jgi:hypothetical protein
VTWEEAATDNKDILFVQDKIVNLQALKTNNYIINPVY